MIGIIATEPRAPGAARPDSAQESLLPRPTPRFADPAASAALLRGVRYLTARAEEEDIKNSANRDRRPGRAPSPVLDVFEPILGGGGDAVGRPYRRVAPVIEVGQQLGDA